MLTAKAKYGLKAMIRLAESYGGEGVTGTTIAESQRIPKKFLEGILLQLKGAGLLFSKKGKGGGYFLARPPAKISVSDIVCILEGTLALLPCASTRHYRPCIDCTHVEHCIVRATMIEVRDATAAILDNTSLLSLVPANGEPVVLFYDI